MLREIVYLRKLGSEACTEEDGRDFNNKFGLDRKEVAKQYNRLYFTSSAESS